MDTNIKATLLACIFTLILSVGGAYGVLKIDDANMKSRIESLDKVHTQRFNFITQTLDNQQKYIYIFQGQMEKMSDEYSRRTDESMNRLDQAMCKFADKVENLSNSIARLEERLKPIEARRGDYGS